MATTEKIIIEIDVVNNTLKDTEDKIKKVSGALVKMRGDEKANENQLRATEAELRLLNKTYREQDRVLQASIKANQAAEGSLAQLKAQYVVAQAALNNMSAEQRENTAEGQAQLQEVARLNAELKRIESSYGQNARNVGNYSEAVKPLKVQLRELTQQLQQLEVQGKGNSAEFQELSAKAGQIKDSISDVNNTVKALASDTKYIDGFAQGVTGIAGAFSVAQGASALFGDENKDLQQTLVKVQSTMLIANGVQQVANTLQKDSALLVSLSTAKTKAAAAAQVLYTAVVGGTTGALKVLRIALAATGIGLVIVGVGLLVEKIIEWTEKTDEQTDSEASLKMALDANIKAYDDTKKQIELVNNQKDIANKRNIDLAKSLGASTEAITKLQNKSYEDQIKGLENLRLRAGAAYAQLTGFNAAYVTDLVKSNDKIVGAIADVPFVVDKKNVEQAQKLLNEIIDINNKIGDAQTAIITGSNEKIIKAQEDYAKARKDALKALTDLENRILDDNLQYQLNQLAQNYEKEQLIIDTAYSNGKAKDAQYYTDKLALKNDYLTKVKDLISKEFTFEQAVRDTQLVAIDSLNKQVTDSIQKRDDAQIELTQKTIDYNLTVVDSFNSEMAERQTAISNIVTQNAQLINKAFTDSITETGFDLKKFAKSSLAIILDTIEQIVEMQYLASIGIASLASLTSAESIATFGVAGIAKALLMTGLIKAAFTAFKTAIASQFEFGGIIPKAANGMLVGASHAQGGIKIGTPSGMIEAEGGEAIINKRSTAMFAPVLSAINQAGGGVKFADGGLIAPNPVSQMIDYNQLAEAMANVKVAVAVEDINLGQQKYARVLNKASI